MKHVSMLVLLFCIAQNVLAKDVINVPEAMTVNISTADLQQVISQTKNKLFDGPQSLQIPGPIELGSISIFDPSVTDVNIDFSIGKIAVETNEQGVLIRSSIDSLSGLVSRVWLSDNQYCKNIPLQLQNSPASFSIQLKPTVNAKGEIEFPVSNYNFNLRDDQIAIGSPERCDVFFGLNWLIELLIPSVGGSLGSTFAQGFEPLVNDFIKSTTKEIDIFQQISIDLPLPEFGPFMGFQLQATAYPNQLMFYDGGIGVVMDVEFILDGNKMLGDRLVVTAPAMSDFSNDFRNSNMHIPVDFINKIMGAVLTSPSIKGLQIDATNTAEFSTFLNTDLLKLIIPEIGEVFETSRPVSFRISNFGDTKLESAPGKQGVYDLQVAAFSMDIVIDEEPLYTLDVGGSVEAQIMFDQVEKMFGFELVDLSQLQVRAFDGYTGEEVEVDDNGWSFFLQSLKFLIARSPLLQISVPDVAIGAFQPQILDVKQMDSEGIRAYFELQTVN